MSTPLIDGEAGVWLSRFGGPKELEQRVGSRTCYSLDVPECLTGEAISLNLTQAKLLAKTILEDIEREGL